MVTFAAAFSAPLPLPDASAVKTLADLGWWSIYAADPSLYSGDGGVAYKNYYDTLLENKRNSYTMPCLSSCNYDELTEEEAQDDGE